MRRIYLDHNATTPLDPRILKVFIQELENDQGNPSSSHFHGRQSRHQLNDHREAIARFFGVKPQEIIFTSGGTEGAALLLQGMIRRHPKGHVISSHAEHACVYQTLKYFERQGTPITFLSTGSLGAVRLEQIEHALRPDTSLITLIAVNNETGVLTSIDLIAAFAHRHGIPLIVDGVAWLGKAPFQLPLGVSAAFFSGHKIQAPKGIGFCICRQGLKLDPLFWGGVQESQRRAGTEPLPAIGALAEAIRLLDQEQELKIKEMRRLRDHFEKELLTRLPDVVINGQGPRVGHVTNLSFLGVDGETLLICLDQAGISASHGSACSSGSLELSRALLDMGLPLEQVRSSVRFSLGYTTTDDEICETIERIVTLVNRLRQVR